MTSLQTVVVDREAARVSKETCDALRPRHRKIVNEIATRLRALGEILEEEYRFRATLDAAGVASHSSWLRPMPLNGVGLPLRCEQRDSPMAGRSARERVDQLID